MFYNDNFSQDDSPSAHQRPSSPLPRRLCQCSRYVALIIVIIFVIVAVSCSKIRLHCCKSKGLRSTMGFFLHHRVQHDIFSCTDFCSNLESARPSTTLLIPSARGARLGRLSISNQKVADFRTGRQPTNLPFRCLDCCKSKLSWCQVTEVNDKGPPPPW